MYVGSFSSEWNNVFLYVLFPVKKHLLSNTCEIVQLDILVVYDEITLLYVITTLSVPLKFGAVGAVLNITFPSVVFTV